MPMEHRFLQQLKAHNREVLMREFLIITFKKARKWSSIKQIKGKSIKAWVHLTENSPNSRGEGKVDRINES